MPGNSILLARLSARAQTVFDVSDAKIDRHPSVLEQLVEPFDRDIDLSAMVAVVNEAMKRFGNKDGKWESESDAWLGPRIHCALRLTRAEASDQDIWNFLAAYAFPDYICWRWKSRTSDRFFGSDIKKQGFKRLWWGAELFRNGSDYSKAAVSLSRTDFSNTIFTLRAIHNRAIALAVAQYWAEHTLSGRQSVVLSTQLNTTAVTVALDRVAPVPYLGSSSLDRWVREESEIHEVLSNPIGPNDHKVSADEIKAVLDVFGRVIDLGAEKDVA